jgi:ABC-type transport system involved in cytochrome c biogenesis permease subunit
MITWLVLVLLTAALNLFVFVAIRGRWGRVVLVLALAALLGTIAGNAIGERLSVNLVRIGDFEFASASIVAQLAMLVTLLLAAVVPQPAPPADGP